MFVPRTSSETYQRLVVGCGSVITILVELDPDANNGEPQAQKVYGPPMTLNREAIQGPRGVCTLWKVAKRGVVSCMSAPRSIPIHTNRSP